MRLKVIFKPLGAVKQIVDSVCSWENPWCTIAVLIGYNAAVWNFQPYMIPLGLIIGILVCRQMSKNSYRLDALSSAKSFVGLRAGNLGLSVNRGRLFGPGNSHLGDDLTNDVSLQSSFECENEVFINNDLLYSLENEVGCNYIILSIHIANAWAHF